MKKNNPYNTTLHNTMKTHLILIIALLFTCSLFGFEPYFAKDPAISPDGTQVCFVYQDDLWVVPFKGGDARRLTSTVASEWNPIFSPDGETIAFCSNREGQSFVYTVPSKGGIARALIREAFSISDWYPDGSALLGSKFCSRYGNSLYRIPIDGTRPTLVAKIGHPFATISLNADKIVFNHRGDAYREAYEGSINGELWEIDIKSGIYTRLTNTPLTERYPRFSHFSNSLFYCASDGTSFQLTRVENYNFDRPIQITRFDTWSARDISIARVNDRIVFERFDEIWKYDPTKISGERVMKLDINIPLDDWEDSIVSLDIKNYVQNYSVSDNDLVVMFQSKYDLFAMPKKGGEVKQISFDHSGIENIVFLSNDNTAIINRLHNGKNTLFKVHVDSLLTMQPVDWFGRGMYHVDSIYRDPWDRWVIIYTDDQMGGRIAVADSMFENISPINIPRYVSSGFSISPDGKHAIYATFRDDISIRELYLYEFESGTSRKILNDDQGIGLIHWLPDYKSVLISRNGNIYRLDFVVRDEFELEKDHWHEILNKTKSSSLSDDETKEKSDTDTISSKNKSEKSSAESKTAQRDQPDSVLKVLWEGIETRLYPVIEESSAYLSVLKVIDDSTFFYLQDTYFGDSNSVVKKANIYGKNVKEEFKLGKNISTIRLIKDNLYYIENGVIKSYDLVKKSKSEISINHEYTYDRNTLNRRVFEQVWGAFGLNFYDPNMHGKDWKEVYNRFLPFVEKAKSIKDIEVIVNEMIGDVNASHTGFYPRTDSIYPSKPIAQLGLLYDYEQKLDLGIRISEIFPRSRLFDLYGVRNGDIIKAIDNVTIMTNTPIDSLLMGKIGKRIKLNIIRGDQDIVAFIDGLSRRDQYNLYYRSNVDRNRRKVDELSNNRLGYVHIPAMGSSDYTNFIRDVFRDNADKEALIIDVRGNSGGRIHDQIATFLLKRHYAYSSGRRMGAQTRLEPRRIWNKPSIVLVDERSFSDGEIFPIIYQELKLGKVVGMPSSGSVIGTWQYDLIDGSAMRMPGSGWYKLDGTNMEGSGAIPDILVDLTPNDIINENDVQLQTAINELLKELNNE